MSHVMLQENMAKWQNKLKVNESRVKELTTSQQNLATAGLPAADVKPMSAGMVRSISTSATVTKQPFADRDDPAAQSVPAELHKVSCSHGKPQCQTVKVLVPCQCGYCRSLGSGL